MSNNRNTIKNTLNLYLKQKNYPINERFRRSDLVLTQSKEDFLMDLKIRNEISRTNSFTFSNISSLSGTASPVDQHVGKLVKFVSCQRNVKVRDELQKLLAPLVCHLFIEMLKGRDWRLAHDFLRRYASLAGAVQEIPPLKINGTDPNSIAPQPINFQRYPGTSGETNRELITSLSCILHLEDAKDNKLITNFRSCKTRAQVSRKSLNALHKFLSKHGHVLVIQALNTWFKLDLYELHDESTDSSGSSSDCHTRASTADCDKPKDIKFSVNSRIAAGEYEVPIAHDEDDEMLGTTSGNLKLKRLRECLHRVDNKYHKPIRIFNINYTENTLCSAAVDNRLCHMAAGFEDSTILLWSLNYGYENYGRKPYQPLDERLCQWSINNCNRTLTDDLSDCESDGDVETNLRSEACNVDDEDAAETERMKCSSSSLRRKKWNKYRRRTDLRQQWDQYLGKSCSETNFSPDSQSIVLRGHRNAVTDVVFGRKEDILLSVSRDKTFRLWKPDSYTCASVYRGHEYPIWCIDESSNGCYAVTGSRDTTARLWSYERKFPVKIYPGHTQDVDCIAFHPNGNYFATGSTDTTIRMWCVTTGKLLRIFTECRLPINAISFSPDGKLLAAAGDETKIRIFDLAAGQQLTDLKNHTASVKSLCWSSNSQKLMSGCTDGSFYIWNINFLPLISSNTSTNTNPKDSKSSPAIAGPSNMKHPAAITAGESSKLSSSGPSGSNISSSSSTLIQSNSTGCKRIVKVFFHGPDELVHAIGND